MGAAIIGTIAFLLSLYLVVKKRLAKIAILLMLIAGFCSIGLVSRVVHWLVATVLKVAGKGSMVLFGAGVLAIGIVLSIIVIAEMWFSMSPKRGQPRTWHVPLAFAAPTLLAAAGGIFATVSNTGNQMLDHVSAFMAGIF